MFALAAGVFRGNASRFHHATLGEEDNSTAWASLEVEQGELINHVYIAQQQPTSLFPFEVYVGAHFGDYGSNAFKCARLRGLSARESHSKIIHFDCSGIHTWGAHQRHIHRFLTIYLSSDCRRYAYPGRIHTISYAYCKDRSLAMLAGITLFMPANWTDFSLNEAEKTLSMVGAIKS